MDHAPEDDESAATAATGSVDALVRQLQSLLSQMQLAEAQTLAAEIVYRFPGQGYARHVLGALNLREGNIVAALPQLKAACNLLADDPEAHNNLGCALQRDNQFAAAEISFRHALNLRADFAQAQQNLGVVLRELGRYQESEIGLRAALALVPEYADACFNLGLTLTRLNQGDAAQQQFDRALQINPNHTHALIALGNARASLGQFGEAENYYLNALSIEPGNLAAWSAIPEIRKMNNNDLDWLRAAMQVLPRCQDLRETSRYHFSMAKFFDDIGDPDQAFQQYRRANDLSKLISPPYQAAQETENGARICTTFNRVRLAQPHPNASLSERPVFIVGMPRSGTSLVEQIVASHSQVTGAGELNFWSNALLQSMPPAPDQDIDALAIAALADSYATLLNQYSSDSLRVIDKAPHNFRNLGLIFSVFPRAKILHLQRNPVDTCLSIYFQDFTNTFSFANDLNNLVHYYRLYQNMMQHWRAVLPASQFLDVPYDALVNDQQGWSRKIIGFLGLDWEPRCIEFQKTVRKVDTASQWQVRQGMYSTSLERWRKYEQHVGPLRELLNQPTNPAPHAESSN